MASYSLTAPRERRTPSLEEAVSALETRLGQIEPGRPETIEPLLQPALDQLAEAAKEALR
ncbi:MAG: hypothetical protein DCF16_03965 [Alphaproteobacteria bacterium]|nr:MAG: hypothetical protein DCF16_03965 [Alphaproteobacteria bacterium]